MWFFIYSTFNKITSFPWKLNRYSYGVQFGINCTAPDQSKLRNFDQWTIIKVREWTLHIGPPTKVIPLKSLYPVLPRKLLARCVDAFVQDLFTCMSFRFVSFQSKGKLCWDVFFDILITTKGASALGMFWTFYRSLNKRRMSPAQTITTEWTAEKCLDKRQTTNKPPNTS